jgi:ferredoxin
VAVRNIIHIDENKCDGCGLCAEACHEGAIRIVDGKARLASESYCDGLGACIGHCPQDALTVESRESPPFDEIKTREHLKNMKNRENPAGHHHHSEEDHHAGIKSDHFSAHTSGSACGCPGAAMRTLERNQTEIGKDDSKEVPSELTNWPVQLHLAPPSAPYFKGADLIIAADCVAYAYAGFHQRFLRGGNPVVIGCPKLDDVQAYSAKISDILAQSGVRSLTGLRMEVPGCGGIVSAARRAVETSGHKNIPFREIIIGINGKIKESSKAAAGV